MGLSTFNAVAAADLTDMARNPSVLEIVTVSLPYSRLGPPSTRQPQIPRYHVADIWLGSDAGEPEINRDKLRSKHGLEVPVCSVIAQQQVKKCLP